MPATDFFRRNLPDFGRFAAHIRSAVPGHRHCTGHLSLFSLATHQHSPNSWLRTGCGLGKTCARECEGAESAIGEEPPHSSVPRGQRRCDMAEIHGWRLKPGGDSCAATTIGWCRSSPKTLGDLRCQYRHGGASPLAISTIARGGPAVCRPGPGVAAADRSNSSPPAGTCAFMTVWEPWRGACAP